MARMLGNNDLAFEAAGSQFWVVDAKVSIFIIQIVIINDPYEPTLIISLFVGCASEVTSFLVFGHVLGFGNRGA